MPGTAVARRYAQAIYRIAQDQQNWDQWVADLHALARLAGDAGFRNVMESPKVPEAQKFTFIDEQLTDIGPLAKQLAKLLVTKHRVDILPEVAADFQQLVDALNGIEHVQVTTAVPLEASESAALKDKLQAYTGKQVILTTDVDPSIISGVVIRIGDKLIDGSIQSRLDTLRRQLVGA